MRLSSANAGVLPDWVHKPSYDRTAGKRRIVHLGLGAFHRAHQALYTEDAIRSGDSDWRITGVSLRSKQVRDALAPQDCLYAVVEKGAGGTTTLVGAIDNVLVGPEDPRAVVAALADPATAVVTLTVTEKGYYRRPDTGGLLTDAPEIAADLAGNSPATIYGYIAAALDRRRQEESGGLTLVCCDNLPSNGQLLQRLLIEFLELRDAALAAWAREQVAFPSTMVDRIVPAVTTADIDRWEAATGVRDEALVVAEPFRQWVIEDRFAGPRPRWEAGGAQFVEDVAPFELAKLRLLNGTHSALAYLGLALGHQFVHEAVSDPDLGQFVRRQMGEEAGPSLGSVRGLDPVGYAGAILKRFDNPELPHRLAQIAMDGSQKVPQRWLATIAGRVSDGQASPRHILSVAAWIAYTRGRTPSGEPYAVDDPHRDHFAGLWSKAGSDLRALVDSFIATTGIFPPVLRGHREFGDCVAENLIEWMEQGPRATLLRHVSQRREPCPQH